MAPRYRAGEKVGGWTLLEPIGVGRNGEFWRVDAAEPKALKILSFCTERLAKYKCPRSVDFIEEMPRDPNGKLYKRTLRDPYCTGREHAISPCLDWYRSNGSEYSARGRWNGGLMTTKGLERAAVRLAVLALALASCGDGAKTPAAPKLTNTLNITGSEYKFELDKTSIEEGTAQVTFKNTGTEYHVASWKRLKAGTTFQTLLEAVRKDFESALGVNDPASSLVEEPANDGSPAILSPGQQTTITTNLLKAGSYALLCGIPARDGMPHLAKGMVAGLEVKAAPTPAPTPLDVKTDGEVTLTEYSFGTLPEALAKGKGTVKFTNAGKEPHEAVLIRFEPGKTFKDADDHLKAFFENPHAPPTQPPVVFVGGFFSIAPGASIWLTIDLPPGKYGLTCDERTEAGKTHGEDLGMRVTFEVT